MAVKNRLLTLSCMMTKFFLFVAIYVLVGCEGQREFRRLLIDPDGTFVLWIDRADDNGQSLYYSVEYSSKEIIPRTYLCASNGHTVYVLRGPVNGVLGLFEKDLPSRVLALVDLADHTSWPFRSGTETTLERDQKGTALLLKLRAALKDTSIQLAE